VAWNLKSSGKWLVASGKWEGRNYELKMEDEKDPGAGRNYELRMVNDELGNYEL
jgi:hypothetical protein